MKSSAYSFKSSVMPTCTFKLGFLPSEASVMALVKPDSSKFSTDCFMKSMPSLIACASVAPPSMAFAIVMIAVS